MKKKFTKSARILLTLIIIFQILFMPLAVIAETGENYASDDTSISAGSDNYSDSGSIDQTSSFPDSGDLSADMSADDSIKKLQDNYSDLNTEAPVANDLGTEDPVTNDSNNPAAGETTQSEDLTSTDMPEVPASDLETPVGNDAGIADTTANTPDSGGDCYTVTITEVDADGLPVETPGLVINYGDSGKETNLMFTFEEVGYSNIAVTTITIAEGFFWEATFDSTTSQINNLLIEAEHDDGTFANWQFGSYDDSSKELMLYGDALFQGGWVSAILLGITTPDTPGIYTFETEVQALETFSNGDPIYDEFDQLQYRPNQLTVGHDQPTLWVAGNEVVVGSDEYVDYAIKQLVDPLTELLLSSLKPNYDITVSGPWVDGGVVQQAIDEAKAYDVVSLEPLDEATMTAIVNALTSALNLLGGFNLPSELLDLLPFGNQYIVDQIDLNKSIYLRGTGNNNTTLMIIGPAGGGKGLITTPVGVGEEHHVHINNLNIEQSQLPFLSPTVEFWKETQYQPPTLEWTTTWYQGFSARNVTVPANYQGGYFKPIEYSGWNVSRQNAWDNSSWTQPIAGWRQIEITYGPNNLFGNYKNTESGTKIGLDIHQVDDYLINISQINSFTMENTNVKGAGRFYHTFDVQRVLNALNSLGLGINDVEPVIDLVQDPEDITAWVNFFNGLNIDLESAAGLLPEILSIIIDAYRWNNAITGVNLNNVGYANLSKVNVEKFSRNGISFTDVQDIFMSDITVQKTGSHLCSAGIAFDGDVNNVSFGGGRISQAPIGIKVGPLSSHGLDLEWDYFNLGCLQFPYLSSINPANFTIRKVNFEQNLVGVMNLGGLVEHDGQIHYSPNFFLADARCNSWNGNLFDTLGLVKSCGLPPECVKPALPDKPTYTITADGKIVPFTGIPFSAFTHHGAGEVAGIPLVLHGTPSFGDADGAVNPGFYTIHISGLWSLNYFIEVVDAMLQIQPAGTNGGGGDGGFDFDFPFFPFPPLTLLSSRPAALVIGPEEPLVEPGDYLVIPPDDPQSEDIPLIDPEFVLGATAEELAAAWVAYNILNDYFDEFWEEMGEEEYAKHLLDLSAAWAALLAREAALKAEAGETFDLDAIVEAYDLATDNYSKYGEFLNEEQDQAFNAVLDAVAEVIAVLTAELAA